MPISRNRKIASLLTDSSGTIASDRLAGGGGGGGSGYEDSDVNDHLLVSGITLDSAAAAPGMNIGTATKIVAPNNYEPLIVENAGTEFSGSYFKIRDGNSTAGQYTWLGTNSNVTYLYSDNNHVAMQMTNDGIITTENQPSFAAGITTNNFTTSSSNTIVPFDAEIFDQGNDFNTSTYTFTCPKDGKYLCNVWLNRYTDSRFDMSIKVGGSTRHTAEIRTLSPQSSDQWQSKNVFVILDLYETDTVQIYITSVYNAGTGMFDGGGSYYDVWSMHKLS